MLTAASRRVILIAASGFLIGALAAPANAGETSPGPAGSPAAATPTEGLYGVQDPTHDGTYRQSLALIALKAAGRTPPEAAIAWLARQQCPDGGWAAFRADPASACEPTGEDSNSTAMAVQALDYVGGRERAVSRGLDWLMENQNPDGGFGFSPGSPTDANSTALAISAMVAGGGDPGIAQEGSAPAYDALAGLQIRCDGPPEARGAFAYQAEGDATLIPNDSATAQATIAMSGRALPIEDSGAAGTPDPLTLACPQPDPVAPDRAAQIGAAYLEARLVAENHRIPPPQGGAGADFGTTANAVLALAATDRGGGDASLAAEWLAGQVDAWVKDESGADRPAALASLILVARATGGSPESFGGVDLVSRLAALGPPLPDPAASESEENGSFAVTLIDIATIVLAAMLVIFFGRRVFRRPWKKVPRDGRGNGDKDESGGKNRPPGNESS